MSELDRFAGTPAGHLTAPGTLNLSGFGTLGDRIVYGVVEVISAEAGYPSMVTLGATTAAGRIQLRGNAATATSLGVRLDVKNGSQNVNMSAAGTRVAGIHVMWAQIKDGVTLAEYNADSPFVGQTRALDPGDGLEDTPALQLISTASSHVGLEAIAYRGAHDELTRSRIIRHLMQKYGIAADTSTWPVAPIATDRVTLTVLPAPTYVRTYYLLQESTLSPPATPTTNPPAAPWSTTEPTYTEGSTQTLYTTQLVAYGTAAFEYGEVQKSSAYEASKAAYNKALAALIVATTADGRLTVSSAAPTVADGAGKPAGAVWFRKDGSNQFIGAWEWTGGAWGERAIENSMIATLDAGKINTGYLDVANRVRAGAVNTRHLAVSDLTNYLPAGGFESEAELADWESNGGAVRDTTDTAGSAGSARFASPGSNGKYLSAAIAVRPGQQWRFSYAVKSTADYNGTGTNGKFRIGDQAGAHKISWAWPNTAGEWVTVTREYVVPEGMTQLQARLSFDHTVGTVWLDNIEARLMNAGELLVDGTITASKVNVAEFFADTSVINEATIAVLRANVVEVDHLAPNVGEVLNLSANGSINMVVAGQSQLNAELSQAKDDLAGLADTATGAADEAAAARAAAGRVTGQVSDLRTEHDATKARMDKVETYVRVDKTGLHLGSSGSAFQAHVLPGRFQITEGTVVQTYWSSGVMVVPTIDVGTITFENHKIETYGTGTVIRNL